MMPANRVCNHDVADEDAAVENKEGGQTKEMKVGAANGTAGRTALSIPNNDMFSMSLLDNDAAPANVAFAVR